MEKRKLGQARALRVFLCTYTFACTAWMRRGGARNMHFQVFFFAFAFLRFLIPIYVWDCLQIMKLGGRAK